MIIRREKKEKERPRERSWERSYRGSDEDIILRHDENERRHKDEVIIRRNDREPSPEYVPPPEPEPIRAPPIHQEVITHHRHIDHGWFLFLYPQEKESVELILPRFRASCHTNTTTQT